MKLIFRFRQPLTELLYTMLVNGRENFTPAEMAITDFIPAQIKTFEQGRAKINFLRRVFFGHTSALFDERAAEDRQIDFFGPFVLFIIININSSDLYYFQ